MKCAAVAWSSPLQRGVQETSPRPSKPSSVWIFTNRKGETECDPPRPLLMASSGLIGTRIGMVSMRVIFMLSPQNLPDRNGRSRMLKAPPEKEAVDRQNDQHEPEPPDAKILEARIALTQLWRQARIVRAPDN